MFECVRESILETEREMERRRRKREFVCMHTCHGINVEARKQCMISSIIFISASFAAMFSSIELSSGFTILKLILSDIEKFMDFTLYRDLLQIKSINSLNVLYIAAQLMLFLSEDKLYTIPPLFWKCFKINVYYLLLVNNISL